MSQRQISSTTPEALRAAIAEAVQVDASQLQGTVGAIAVATSTDAQVSDPSTQSLYDKNARTLTLLADRIPAGQEVESFATALSEHLGHEITVDLVGQEAASRAQQLLQNQPVANAKENTAMTDHVIRYVVTHMNRDGVRTLCSPAQGRFTNATPEEAQALLDAMMQNNPMDGELLAGVYGLPLEVRPVKCYPGHFDPMHVYFHPADPSNQSVNEPLELEVTMRSKTTFGTDKESIRVWDGQSAKDVAERVAQGYGAEVVEIRNPDGSLYEEPEKADESPSPGM